MIGYTDAGYLSDPHNARSQTGFVFLHGGTAISWKSSKQTLVATSTNHSEIIALCEASRECVWLRRMINHIQQSCGIGSIESPTIIYEDNTACVAQMQTGYIKSNITKHIAPKLFFPMNFRKAGKQTSCKSNHAKILLIYLPSLYQVLYYRNMFMELVCDDFGTCKYQGESHLETPLLIISHYLLSCDFIFQDLLKDFNEELLREDPLEMMTLLG